MAYQKKGKNKNKKRVSKTKRELFKSLLKGILYLLIISGFLYSYFTVKKFILLTDFFQIERITVKGRYKSKEEEIINSSGLKYGENIFSFSIKKISSKVSENQWVQSAKVTRKLPGTVLIEVMERKPMALLHLDDFYLLDREGIAFKKVDWERDNVDLPVVSGVAVAGALRQGKDKKFENKPLPFVKKSLLFLNLLKENNVFQHSDISEIHMDPDFGLHLYCMKNVAQFQFGFSHYKEKLCILKKVMKDLETRKIGYKSIDMCGYPKKVFVKLIKD
ncbi:MAG: FtsQ-type POTRA domain-containing protein [Thermodesulfobacteriota bacterium]|nr:FtsQ-type POTRA domain-containing protein [Thermodesulfobacteriota bacterium]